MSGFTDEERAAELKRRDDALKPEAGAQKAAMRRAGGAGARGDECLHCGSPMRWWEATNPEIPLCDICFRGDCHAADRSCGSASFAGRYFNSYTVASSALSRIPLNDGCRSLPSSVQARYSTSATSTGSQNTALFRFSFTAGESVAISCSTSRSFLDSACVHPVPQPPT